jgi:hypothetical protein
MREQYSSTYRRQCISRHALLNRRPPSQHPLADQREIERRAPAQAASSTLSSREVDSEEAAGMDTERLSALRRLLFKF